MPKVKDWKLRNPGACRRPPGHFKFDKCGLWELWTNFPPERDWLPPEVYKRVRRVRIRYQDYWFVEKPDLYEMIHNKVSMKVSPTEPPESNDLPPEAEPYTPTEVEDEESEEAAHLSNSFSAAKHAKIKEADPLEISDDDEVIFITMMKTADPLPISHRDGVRWQGEVEHGGVSVMDVSVFNLFP